MVLKVYQRHQPQRQRALQEDRQEGKQEASANLFLHLIERKFGPPPESVRTRIACADPDTLLAWSERILTDESVEAVLH